MRGEAGHAFSNIKLKNLTVINFPDQELYIGCGGIEIDHAISENGAHVVPGPRYNIT